MAQHSDDPWAHDDPRTITHPGRAVIDDDTAALLDEAVVELTLLRSPMRIGDCLADLHALASLRAQIHAWLPVAVAGARDQGHRWADIAGQLGVTPATARRRHAAYTTMTRKMR